jgi:peptide/nickel transport system substrate-binding protein
MTSHHLPPTSGPVRPGRGTSSLASVYLSRRQVLAGAVLMGAGATFGGVLAGCAGSAGPGERQRTLYIGGWQWGPAPNFNPLSPTAAFPTQQRQMQLVYETLFAFDLRDGSLQPQLAESLSQPDLKTIVVTLQPGAHWHDGKPVTPDDVVYTFELAKRIGSLPWSYAWDYLAGVTKSGDRTVTFALSPQRTNPGMTKTNFCETYILPAHLWREYEARSPKIAELANEKPVGSGPYRVDSYNAQRIICTRVEDYWGKAVRGKLAAPEKIIHPIFKDNAAGNLAFERGDVDVMQQFTPEIWKMWQQKKLPVGTWFDKPPYYIPGGMPMLTLNTTKKGLGNPKVRRALAFSIDYARIADTAMSKYSEPARSSLILNTDTERQFLDEAAIASHGWKYDPDKANQILRDELGAKKGSDGVYTLGDGTRLGPWKVQTPNGWSDWQAAVQVVAESAKAAGFDLKAEFPEANTVTPAVQNGNYDLAVWYITAQTTAGTPWARFHDVLESRGVPAIGTSAFYNYGRFADPRVAPLLDKAATATGAELAGTLKQLDVIYMETAPMIPLMYRPLDFFEFNEKVWTGFPTAKDPQAPPTFSGAGTLWLYEIRPR